MNRGLLVTVATICGLVMVVALLLFPLVSTDVMNAEGKKESSGVRAVEMPGSGAWLLVFTWIACGFAAIVLLKKADYIGLGEDKARMLSLLGFKLAGFFFLALLIAGTDNALVRGSDPSWGFGFWLAFIASIVGAFTVYLTFNPALAQKISNKAQELREKAASDDDASSGDASSGDAASGDAADAAPKADDAS